MAGSLRWKPAAAELLRPWEVRTVKDVLDLPAWPYGRLRIVIERRPLIEVMIEPRRARRIAANIAKLGDSRRAQ